MTLKKLSDGNALASVWMEGKTSDTFDCTIISALNGFTCDGTNQKDILIEGTDELEIDVEVSSTEIGEKQAYFVLNPVDGIPISFTVIANFYGP